MSNVGQEWSMGNPLGALQVNAAGVHRTKNIKGRPKVGGAERSGKVKDQIV